MGNPNFLSKSELITLTGILSPSCHLFQFLKTLIELLVQIFAVWDPHPAIQRA